MAVWNETLFTSVVLKETDHHCPDAIIDPGSCTCQIKSAERREFLRDLRGDFRARREDPQDLSKRRKRTEEEENRVDEEEDQEEEKEMARAREIGDVEAVPNAQSIVTELCETLITGWCIPKVRRKRTEEEENRVDEEEDQEEEKEMARAREIGDGELAMPR
ncbi:hypothetical protein Sjap_001635 [Stephania japonica]|uniref:Uncharacterized protein n=1 Tax=Stephania japonica TaxID=461633 RepID=A0AAP0KMW0_9MAGN